MLQLGRMFRVTHTSRYESGDGMTAKRKTFWRGRAGGPLPVDAIRGKYNNGKMKILGQSHKAMRYG